MSNTHQYHHANDLDPSGEDPDSDIEFDLQELGSQREAESRRAHSTLQRLEQNFEDSHNDQIPLRNLRVGALRGPARRTRRPYESHLDDGEGSDREPILQGHDPHEDSDLVDDVDPLLSRGRSSTFRETGSTTTKLRVAWKKFQALVSDDNGGVNSYPTGSPRPEDAGSPRTIHIGSIPPRYPPNAISNAKYTAVSFLPRTLYNEFRFFLNLYFLFVALSQIIPPLRIGYLSTYIAPLAFVLSITLGKEALDDIARRQRDAEANKEEYTILDFGKNLKSTRRQRQQKRHIRGRAERYGRIAAIREEEEALGQNGHDELRAVRQIRVKSKDLKVGDVVRLEKDQRVPADLVVLKALAIESIGEPAVEMMKRKVDEDVDLLNGSVDQQAAQIPTTSSAGSSRPRTEQSPENVVGDTFIRTDQLDGETDWKLRLASPITQALDPRDFTKLTINAGKPDKKVNEFLGSIEFVPATKRSGMGLEANGPAGKDKKTITAPLTIDNTTWANTVLASSGAVLAVVVYTGSQTRQAMSTSASRSKTGLLELEINSITKLLCGLTLLLSIVLVAFEGFHDQPSDEDGRWYIVLVRFLILFSTIIPISLRVNLDLGKTVYARFIERDSDIPGAVVRTSTIPEDLGRIEYLLSDKTGTLTQNEMELKKIHVGTVSYANEAMEEVSAYVRQGFSGNAPGNVGQPAMLVTPSSLVNPAASAAATRTRREIGSRVRDVVLALALCHNVTPTTEEDEDGRQITTYQASSPDEIAIVRWTESVGLRVVHRDRHTITLESTDSSEIAVRVRILEVFPFTSEGKRMGIILQFYQGRQVNSLAEAEIGETWFYQKGADTVMTNIVAANDWLDEETANMAREGLRTLVVGRRKLSPQQHADFSNAYKEASISLSNRDQAIASAISNHLENNLELLGVTGVEDKLQKDVKPSLELLRNAGIKIWMLTGDKVETARCVAVSSKLVSRSQTIHTITALHTVSRTNPDATQDHLSLLASSPDSTALLIDGDSLSHLLTHHRQAFISLAVRLPAVIACRCSPTQKADIALLIRAYTKKRIACIGDGGNDVSMIQAADVGVGIVGKEGRQASLAADFSITQFCHLTKLLVWHGRNSYKRSAKLAQFVIHRGLIISIAQTVYSITANFRPYALYRDWLLVGYATIYTMFPVFSLVLDRDVDETLANLYPELYRELTSGRALSYRTFGIWLAVSVYQGALIQILSQLLLNDQDPLGSGTDRMIAVSFTALIINELAMVAFEVTTWHWIMMLTLVGTLATYVASVPFLGEYFDLEFLLTTGFYWRVAVITAGSLVPVYVAQIVGRTLRPPSYRKVRGG
ncbi:putative aminophospholipid-translocase [Agyrium rufum]|nr:putative aminophospholipid-translocase [Agyrium rufum]